MFSIILIFCASCLVSFLGSLQLGPVNLFVINSVLFDTKRTALYVALGGCLPEFIYCGLAVYANNYLLQSDTFHFYFKLVFIIILIVIGFVFLFKKPSQISFKNENVSSEKNELKQIAIK